MRKGLLLGLIVTVLTGLMAPPAAAVETRTRTSNVINVYWHDREELSANTFRLTTWYVGVYESSDGTWSDLYQSVDRCRKPDGGHTRCRQGAYRIGIDDLEGEGQTFTMDSENLESAHLDAVYRLKSYDNKGNRLPGRVPTRIVADLTGRGEIRQHRESWTDNTACKFVRRTYDSSYRRATATGSITAEDIGTVDLGSTRDAFLDSSTYTVQRFCCLQAAT